MNSANGDDQNVRFSGVPTISGITAHDRRNAHSLLRGFLFNKEMAILQHVAFDTLQGKKWWWKVLRMPKPDRRSRRAPVRRWIG
ncbi:MAG: hypothetical protein ACYCQM_10795 [Acidithiobacillus sp.]